MTETTGDATTPSWYDVLGVEPTLDADEIREAWRAQIADLDPSERRFRALNQAAEVLLDPQRRAAHDEELASPATVSLTKPTRTRKPKVTSQPTSDPVTTITEPPSPTRVLPGWLIAGAAVLAAASVVLAAVLFTTRPGGETAEEAARTAEAAAQRGIVPVLSYDYRHLDKDSAAAQQYLTSSYFNDDYSKLFALIKQNAPGTQTVVTTSVVASGIVRSGTDRVQVLLFLDRPTTNKLTKTPVIYKDQVTVTMAKVDGDWLIDELRTTPAQS